MPASSTSFEAVLRPDPRLRRILLSCALLSLPAGLVLIFLAPLPSWLHGVLGAFWAAGGVRECRDLLRGATQVARIELEGLEHLAAVAGDGRRTPLTLLAGSMVLPRIAWLRVRFPDGRHYVELLRPRPDALADWQRLQLIWRLRRAVVGEQDGS